MTMRTNCFLLVAILLGLIPLNYTHANDSIPKSVILYTPYTKISVSPGASIDYSIDLINNSDELTNANLSVSGLGSSWKHEMKSGGWSLSQLSVLPKEKKTFNLKVDVPLKVNKGNYHFVVYAGNAKLPLDVVVAQQGTYQTEFTTDQPNMEGNSKSTFTFSTTLKNQTADQQLYALMANAPRGWNVIFKPNYKQATSAQVEPNSSQNVSIDITPPANVEAGSYKIPVRAATGTTSAELELEVVVTGSFQMELTTPRGLLSTDITAGDVKPKLLRVGMVTALVLAIHNFPEGMVTFLAALKDVNIAIPIAIAIAIHNIPEGISVSVPVFYATGNRKKAFWFSFLSGLAEPVGAVIGYLVLAPFLDDNVFGIIFGMIAGIMVFISLDELLPAAEEYGKHHHAIYGLVVGMAVMALSLLMLG